MPEMDGLAATAAIRNREKGTGSRVPIFALTAHALKGDRETCLAAGMDGYLAKPIDAQALYNAVETLRPPADRPAAPRPEPQPPRAEVMDWAQALHRLGGRSELLRPAADIFIQECPKMMVALRQAITTKDSPGLRRSAHTLKGAADCFAAKAVVAAAARLEAMGRNGNLVDTEDAWTALEQEIDRLLPALKAFAMNV